MAACCNFVFVFVFFIFAKHSPTCRKSDTEENVTFGDYSCNTMKVVGNFPNRLSRHWILVFTAYSLNYEKSNSKENTSILVILAAVE